MAYPMDDFTKQIPATVTNKIAEIVAAESWYIWRDELTENTLLSVIFHCDTPAMLLGFFCAGE